MSDSRKNRIFNSLNYSFIILDEIALEGLDGITWEALLRRLEQRRPFFIGKDKDFSLSEKFIWSIVQKLISRVDIISYRLEEPRKPLVIFDRYQFVDPDLGIIIEPDDTPIEIYPFKLIDGDEKGSCSDYFTRKKIDNNLIEDIPLNEAIKKHGGVNGFVLVASQKNRANAILSEDYDEVSFPLSSMQWCILERIARTRFLGEVSQGILSLQFMNENPKTLFYHRKSLISFGLITKQIHHQKSHGQNFQGTLFHLPRFYTERKSKALILVHNMVSFLKTKPKGMVSCEEMREHLKLGHNIKKVYKSQEFQKFMKGSFIVPYRTLFPDSSEWRCKNSASKEKTIRVVQLLDINVDPESIWQDKKDDEEDEDEGSLFTNQKSVLFDRSLMHQAYKLLEKVGPEGIYQCELGRLLGLGKLEARTVCRNLERRNLVKSLMKDFGRQRVTYYIALRYSHLSKASNQLKIEKEKMASFRQSSKLSSNEVSSSPPASSSSQCQNITDSKDVLKVEINEGSMYVDTEVVDSPVLPSTTDKVIKPTNTNSFRQLSRANAIMESVRQLKVIDDTTKLYKMLLLKEEAEGIKTRMDKKSLLRILNKLAKEKQIRNIRVVLKNKVKKRVLHFVCGPDIDETNTVIQSAIEQAKMKFNITPKVNDELSFRSNDLDAVQNSSMADCKMIYNPRIGKTYGLQPKFIRMREFHVFLYYLTYGYDGKLVTDKDKVYDQWKENNIYSVDDSMKKELEDFSLYSREIGWNMFIPKLPNHQGWDFGWCLMCDVLLRLPLSYFVKLVNITYLIPGIEDYLSHPVKQHYLIQFLPQDIRKKLLFHRKYIFSCYEITTRLAYIGVVQFGPHKLKEKDQFFLFVNKNASLLDTTNSSPGYHKINPSKEYTFKSFNFNSLDDVEQYWYRMWEICIYTPLGVSSNSLGQEITLENMDKKEELVCCLNPKSCEEAQENDTGYLPGDQQGAAGLDSSMFSHLKRNWSWTSNCDVDSSKKNLSNKAGKKGSIKVTLMNNTKSTSRNLKRKRKSDQITRSSSTNVSKSSVRTRIIAKRQKKEERKPYYDDVDKAALRLMRKLRVDWTKTEDSLLLLCKVAGSYLCQNTRYQMVQYTLVRDLLHKRFPESLNKTSRACQRRLNYMMKNPTTADNVSLFLSDVKQDPSIKKLFPLHEYGKNEDDQRLKNNFEPLVTMLVTKYQTVESSSSNSTNMIPDSMEELLDQYIFVFPQTKEGQFYFEDPNSVEEAKALTINTLITSSLCSASDKNSWAFQLFKIYQQYPDWMLRDVMNKLRTNKMVSLKKQCNRSRVKTGNYLPLSSSPYQLSVTFSHVFLNRYQHEIYHQSWDFIKNVVLEYKLRPNNFKEVIVNHEGGYAASVSCLLGLQCLKFKIEVPDQLVVLDPNMSGVDDAYARILRRYKELLRNSGSKEIESDIEAQNLNVNSSSQDDTNNTMLSDEVNNKSMEVTSSKKETQKELTQCAEPLGTNNVIFNERSNVDSPNCTAEERSSQVVARSASRIALHVMKEEYKESSKSSHKEMAKNDKTIQHSHDFFVISSCRIFIKYLSLLKPPSSKTFKLIFSQRGKYKEITRSIFPANIEAQERILNRHGLDVYGKFNVSVDKLRKTCMPCDKTFYKNIPPDSLTFKVYNYIKSGKELGVTGTDLCIQFPDINIEAICISMIDSFLILRAGCVRTRYICIEYSSPWLLHSFKMLRTRHKEAAPNLKHSTKLFNVDPNLENKSNNEVSEAVKKVDWSKVDQIHIILRPWVKIDGNLNRRVLDRLLGAVLGYVMLKPGQYMDKIQQKFSPALQPQHTRELLDMLKELGAINVLKFKRNISCNLFSKVLSMDIVHSSLLDEPEDLIVEPEVDAIIKLGQFIGDKQYSQDFVCQCPCHPDKR